MSPTRSDILVCEGKLNLGGFKIGVNERSWGRAVHSPLPCHRLEIEREAGSICFPPFYVPILRPKC